MKLNPLWESPERAEPHACAIDWPTVLVALFLIVSAAVFPFAHVHISKYYSSYNAVLCVHLNNLSCCFNSHQVILFSSLGTTFVQDFVF